MLQSVQFSSVAQSCPTLCDPMNHSTPPPCPSLTPRVHSHSRPSSQWCHPAISSSVVPFSPCPNPSQHQGINMLSRLVITFLPRSKCLLIPWLQSPSAVILESPKIKSVTVSTVSPSISHEVMGPDAMILVFWMSSLSQLFHSPLSLSSRGSSVLHFLS